ncbi:hypothetical protein GGS23DRAFT_475085 [Durotheca rogersii]|uniref:uncharacterized protein n=1 Tax=Durotheca rogersii TaxID=419775 RepID=UPI00221F2997|nr:uncharacterized protein GGS23DRAFT_475085 [Durotheca rogersii]KAI5854480.1 hypothetical protein GGS23DRAFT_475085 [Durotheca rogersii]
MTKFVTCFTFAFVHQQPLLALLFSLSLSTLLSPPSPPNLFLFLPFLLPSCRFVSAWKPSGRARGFPGYGNANEGRIRQPRTSFSIHHPPPSGSLTGVVRGPWGIGCQLSSTIEPSPTRKYRQTGPSAEEDTRGATGVFAVGILQIRQSARCQRTALL